MLTLRKLNQYIPAAKLLSLCLLVLSLAHPVLIGATAGPCSGPETDAGFASAAALLPAPKEGPWRAALLSSIGRDRGVVPGNSASEQTPGLFPLKEASPPGVDSSAPTCEHNLACPKPAEDSGGLKENEPAPAETAKPSSEAPPVEAKAVAGAALPSRGQPSTADTKPEQPSPPPVKSDDTILNDYVQQIIATYTGYYPYLLNTDYANYNGVSENLYYDNRLLAKAHPSGNRATHCVGVTFEVFFKAMQARNEKLGLPADDFNGMTYEELSDFLQIWYAAGGKQVHNIELAVEKYGLGKRIDRFEEARAGDFMDISRTNGTGHTVVFQQWIRSDSNEIIGIRYWSSQDSGVGFNTEYFAATGRGSVCSSPLYIARVLPVHQYSSFR
ncbi:MAG: hypothetical protein GX883_05425 [Firmicutes bacterium]|nr:hypothetical protein [Bacillota bacterium]